MLKVTKQDKSNKTKTPKAKYQAEGLASLFGNQINLEEGSKVARYDASKYNSTDLLGVR